MSKAEHHFNVKVAIQYGIDVATFLDSLAYWIHLNQANNIHFHDGRYWTYNTSQAFTVIFPYWSIDQIDRLIKKCIKNDLIIKGNYNVIKYDKTRWLTFSDKALALYEMSLPQDHGNPTAKSRFLSRESAEPIPITNTDTNKSFNISCSNAQNFDKFWEAYPKKQGKRDALKAWGKISEEDQIKILADIPNRLARDQQWQSQKFIPLPATYLRGERWNDEIITITLKTPPSSPGRVGFNPKPNEPRSTVPWFNPDHANLSQSQGVIADATRDSSARDHIRRGDLFENKSTSVRESGMGRRSEASSTRSDSPKTAGSYFLPRGNSD